MECSLKAFHIFYHYFCVEPKLKTMNVYPNYLIKLPIQYCMGTIKAKSCFDINCIDSNGKI